MPKWIKWAALTPVVLIQVNLCLEVSLTDTAALGRHKGDFVPSRDLAHNACFAVGSAVDNAAAAAAVAASNRNGLVEGPRGVEDAARCTEVYSRAHCLSLEIPLFGQDISEHQLNYKAKRATKATPNKWHRENSQCGYGSCRCGDCRCCCCW